MPRRKEFRRLSKRARLLLAGSEGLEVDFKREPQAVHSDDLVAFANSPDGGAFLVGVDEVPGEEGPQRGRVVGCAVGDGERLRIVNRAQQCIPPVQIEIYVENLAATPFLRVEVPSSPSKPHSTSAGTYKIRGDGRNVAMTPDAFLGIVVEREAELFRGRFREVATSLGESLEDLLERLGVFEGLLSALSDTAGTAASGSGRCGLDPEEPRVRPWNP